MCCSHLKPSFMLDPADNKSIELWIAIHLRAVRERSRLGKLQADTLRHSWLQPGSLRKKRLLDLWKDDHCSSSLAKCLLKTEKKPVDQRDSGPWKQRGLLHEWKAPYVKNNWSALKNKLASSDWIPSCLDQVTSCLLKACLVSQRSSKIDEGTLPTSEINVINYLPFPLFREQSISIIRKLDSKSFRKYSTL